jgi:hypothetical protein
MSPEEDKAKNVHFDRLLGSLKLLDIKQVALYSRRLGDSTATTGVEPSIEIKQAQGKEDPIKLQDQKILFRTRFDVKASNTGTAYFEHFSEYFMTFELVDSEAYTELWQDSEIRTVFLERQVKRTLWPLLRERVLDGMLRVGLQPVTLPWIL